MSAAEPAVPTPPTVNTSGGAAVYDITMKRAGRHTAAGRWKRMNDTEPGIGSNPADPVRLLADTSEKSFNARGLTLTDDDTAAAYTLTLELVEKALEGAQVQNIIDGTQREKLAALINGMKAAPGLV